MHRCLISSTGAHSHRFLLASHSFYLSSFYTPLASRFTTSAQHANLTSSSSASSSTLFTMSQQQQQQQQQQGRPSRPPQQRRTAFPQNGGNSATVQMETDDNHAASSSSSSTVTPRKRANETQDQERPAKAQQNHPQQTAGSSQDVRGNGNSGQQQNNNGGGFRGGRGGMRGGRGGGQQQQQQSQSNQPHQSRPQSAAPQRGGRGGQHNNGNRQPQQRQPSQSPVSSNDGSSMMDDSPVAASASSSSSHAASRFSDPNFKTEDTFAGLGLSAKTAKSLAEEFQYTNMSIVQSKCIPTALTGVDLVAKAKTGTGKTLAFLIPVVERVLAKKANLPRATSQYPVRALVISPTRELAQQIEDEAIRLGKFHDRFKVACVVGGLAIAKDLRQLQSPGGLDLLIATPGRLKDLLQNYPGIKDNLSDMVSLVLDEADRLLDMGFKPDLDAIFAMLPGVEKRQTQLFSATFPASTQEMTRRTLKKEYVLVNTVGDEDDQTHQHVVQESIIVPLAQQYEALYELIESHKASCPHYKIIVFFTTARVAGFSSQLFNAAGSPTLELHSRLSQSKRTKTSDTFRDGEKMVLFSSDVSARGLDFPGVTLIIQVGLTTAEQYVHRLGRTARAGKEGHGIIMLAPFESNFLNILIRKEELPIQPIQLDANSSLIKLSAGQEPQYSESLRMKGFSHPIKYAIASVDSASSSSSSSSGESLKTEAEQAYRAYLGFYNGNLKTCGWDKVELVRIANSWSAMIGLREVPSLEPKTVGKMGLKGTPGLRIEAVQRHGGGGGNGGGYGGGRGGSQNGGGGGRGGGSQRGGGGGGRGGGRW